MSIDAGPVECMAQAIYHEARGESERGKIAVGHVIINREKSGKWGKGGICRVVLAPNQFTGFRLGKYKVGASYLRIAEGIIRGDYIKEIGSALYFNRWDGRGIRIGAHGFR